MRLMADRPPASAARSRRANVERNAAVGVRAAKDLIGNAGLEQVLGFLDPETIAAASSGDGASEAFEATAVRRAFPHRNSTQAFNRPMFLEALSNYFAWFEPFGQLVTRRYDGKASPYFSEAVEAIAVRQFATDPISRGLRSLLLILTAVADTDPQAKLALQRVDTLTRMNLGRLRSAYQPDESPIQSTAAVDGFSGWLWGCVWQVDRPGALLGIEEDISDEEKSNLFTWARHGAAQRMVEAFTFPDGPMLKPVSMVVLDPPPHAHILRAAILALNKARYPDDLLAFLGARSLARQASAYGDIPAGKRPSRDQLTTAFKKPDSKGFDRESLMQAVGISMNEDVVELATDENGVIQTVRSDAAAVRAPIRLTLLASASQEPPEEIHDVQVLLHSLAKEIGRTAEDASALLLASTLHQLRQFAGVLLWRANNDEGGRQFADWCMREIFSATDSIEGIPEASKEPGAIPIQKDPGGLPGPIAAMVRETFGSRAAPDPGRHDGLTIRHIAALTQGVFVVRALLEEREMIQIGCDVTLAGPELSTDTLESLMAAQAKIPAAGIRIKGGRIRIACFAFSGTLTPAILEFYVSCVAELVHEVSALTRERHAASDH
jgi:hypothetical protein